MSDETAAVAVVADSFLPQPEPAASAASTDTVMSFLIMARHSLPESRRFSKPNNDAAKTEPPWYIQKLLQTERGVLLCLECITWVGFVAHRPVSFSIQRSIVVASGIPGA